MNVAQSVPHQAMAWLTEKIARLKLMVDDAGNGAFRSFEALELLRLGIEGKRLLWQTLDEIWLEPTAIGKADYCERRHVACFCFASLQTA